MDIADLLQMTEAYPNHVGVCLCAKNGDGFERKLFLESVFTKWCNFTVDKKEKRHIF